MTDQSLGFDVFVAEVQRAGRTLRWRADVPAWGEHLPFLVWLISTIAPQRHVTLSEEGGLLHSALDLALEQTRPRPVSAELRYRFAEGDQTRWRALEGQPEAPEGEIDVLVVDLPPGPATTTLIKRVWLPRMVPRGLIILRPEGRTSLRDLVEPVLWGQKGPVLRQVGAEPPEALLRFLEAPAQLQRGLGKVFALEAEEIAGTLGPVDAAEGFAEKVRLHAAAREAELRERRKPAEA